MAELKESFKGFEIVIDEDGKLQIDGKSIPSVKLENGNYHSDFLPYTQYASLLELAQQIVAKSPEFDTFSSND